MHANIYCSVYSDQAYVDGWLKHIEGFRVLTGISILACWAMLCTSCTYIISVLDNEFREWALKIAILMTRYGGFECECVLNPTYITYEPAQTRWLSFNFFVSRTIHGWPHVDRFHAESTLGCGRTTAVIISWLHLTSWSTLTSSRRGGSPLKSGPESHRVWKRLWLYS